MFEALPEWIVFKITLVLAKDNFYKWFARKSNNMYHLCAFKYLPNHLNQSFQETKQNYVNKIVLKLADVNTSSKCYKSLLKTLLNGTKLLWISLLFHGDKYIVDSQEESVIFNSFFFHLFSIFSDFKGKQLILWITIMDR